MKLWQRQNVEDLVRQGVEEVFPRLWRYCLVLTSERQQADDLAQAVSLRALENADKFKVGSHFDRWIFTIAQRMWIDELRKTAVRTGGGLFSIDEIELVDAGPNPEDNVLNREVLLGVMTLPEAQRSAVVLTYVEGYSYRDTAQILDIPVGTVMSRLFIARGKLVETFRDKAEVV